MTWPVKLSDLISCSLASHTDLLFLFQTLRLISASGPLPLLFSMPGMHTLQIFTWLPSHLVLGCIWMSPRQSLMCCTIDLSLSSLFLHFVFLQSTYYLRLCYTCPYCWSSSTDYKHHMSKNFVFLIGTPLTPSAWLREGTKALTEWMWGLNKTIRMKNTEQPQDAALSDLSRLPGPTSRLLAWLILVHLDLPINVSFLKAEFWALSSFHLTFSSQMTLATDPSARYFLTTMSRLAPKCYSLCHRWQTQGLWAESVLPPCFYLAAALSSRLTVKE